MRPLFIPLILSSLLSVRVSAQLSSFGTQALTKTGPPFTYAAYGYYDMVREAGIGFQHQWHPLLCMDYSVYGIHPNGLSMATQWDYYDFRGAGLSIKPKWMLSRGNRFYIGATASIEYLKHDRIWVEKRFDKSSHHYDLYAAKGWGSSLGLSIGARCYSGHVLIEPFISLGVTTTGLEITEYGSKSWLAYGIGYTSPYYFDEPRHSYIKKDYFFWNIGFKIGFGWKRPAKAAAIQARFDEVYIPRYNQLMKYLDQQELKDPRLWKERREALIRAKELTAGANLGLLRIYRWRYPRPEKLYRSVDAYFKRIDEQIVKATQ